MLWPHCPKRHCSELGHRLGIGAQGSDADLLLLFAPKSITLRCQQYTRCKTDDIPFIWAREGLIEIINIKQKLTLWRCVKAEIQKMSITE